MIRYVVVFMLLLAFAYSAQAFDTKAEQAIATDHKTQTVLLAKNATETMYPSSMSKLMTLYVLFEKLKQGAITLDTTFPVSKKAWKKGGSKMFVEVGTEVRVEDLIRGIVVQSGNDACIVVAEALGGSEEAFAKIMNDKAEALGLRNSHFVNATGWPDEKHFMTAADLAILTHRIIHDFPEYYPYFAEQSFTYSGITQPNRNRLLGQGLGVDGLKTGHTEAAGYGIVVSAEDSETGRRVNVVVNGLSSDNERLSEARRLAEYALREFVLRTVGLPTQIVSEIPVWMGEHESVQLILSEPVNIALPRDTSDVQFMLNTTDMVPAPIEKGAPLGQLTIMRGEKPLKILPLVAAQHVEKAGWWGRFWHNIRLMSAEKS